MWGERRYNPTHSSSALGGSVQSTWYPGCSTDGETVEARQGAEQVEMWENHLFLPEIYPNSSHVRHNTIISTEWTILGRDIYVVREQCQQLL